ncbi:MAG: 2OG-Fe dioxygenase family protein [Streptosporangiaceae bacterium]
MESYGQITLTNRAGISGKRDHSRVHLLEDPQAEQLIRRLLELMPPERRQPEGTFGINLFRTYTNVVTTPHHDREEYVILYVIDRIGDGAESYLYHPDDVTEDGRVLAGPILKQQLNPGDIFIFEDSQFKHGATPLADPPGGSARRDAFVCTFDYFDTYLGRAAAN